MKAFRDAHEVKNEKELFNLYSEERTFLPEGTMTRTRTVARLVLAFSALISLTTTPGSALAQQASPANQAAQAQSTTKGKLADFAWLEGRWKGELGPRTAEQVWLSPKAGVMFGTFRLYDNDQTVVIELFTLVENPDGVTFYFRHFTPQLVPWEESGATVLKLASVNATKADFENPLNGMPKNSILTRIDADTYTLHADLIPEKGDPTVIQVTYHRQ